LKGKLKITLTGSEGGELIIITSQYLTVVNHERDRERETERDKACRRVLTSLH